MKMLSVKAGVVSGWGVECFSYCPFNFVFYTILPDILRFYSVDYLVTFFFFHFHFAEFRFKHFLFLISFVIFTWFNITNFLLPLHPIFHGAPFLFLPLYLYIFALFHSPHFFLPLCLWCLLVIITLSFSSLHSPIPYSLVLLQVMQARCHILSHIVFILPVQYCHFLSVVHCFHLCMMIFSSIFLSHLKFEVLACKCLVMRYVQEIFCNISVFPLEASVQACKCVANICFICKANFKWFFSLLIEHLMFWLINWHNSFYYKIQSLREN